MIAGATLCPDFLTAGGLVDGDLRLSVNGDGDGGKKSPARRGGNLSQIKFARSSWREPLFKFDCSSWRETFLTS